MFSLDDVWTARFNFSHLSAALSRSQYKKHLGLVGDWQKGKLRANPVPKRKIDQLREVLLWIYGSKSADIQPVIRLHNPDIKHLGDSLENDQALELLRSGASLDEAVASTRSVKSTFTEALCNARQSVREALVNLRGFDADAYPLVGIAEDTSESADLILQGMKKKVKTRNDD